MHRKDNYAITAEEARKRFLTYDLSKIISKTPLTHDGEYLYLPVLDRTCRIEKSTGKMAWSTPEGWEQTSAFHDVLTIFDYLCDSKPNRAPSGEMKSMASFGRLFHSGLLEDREPTQLEKTIDAHPELFQKACLKLGGIPFPTGDMAYTVRFFPDLPMTVQFWHSDEDFPPQLRWLWDREANDFIRYETMFYALGILRERLTFWIESCR